MNTAIASSTTLAETPINITILMFNAAVLMQFLELSLTMGETSLIRYMRQWLREKLVKSSTLVEEK